MEHAEALRRDGGADVETAVAVSKNWRAAKLQPDERAMLEFCEKLTLLPSAMSFQDVINLKEHSFSDKDVLAITLGAGYRNFIVRVADTLGIELRKDGVYDTDILAAYGIQEREVRDTLYGERLGGVSEVHNLKADRPSRKLTKSRPSQGGLWIQPPIANHEEFAPLMQQMEVLTEPYPMTNLASAFGLMPKALEATHDFMRLLGMGGSGLSRRIEGIIGLVTATALWSPYVGTHHAMRLLDIETSLEAVESMVSGRFDDLTKAEELEVATFCAKATVSPNSITLGDVHALRGVGFNDADILTIAASVSFENYLCRVASAMGVEIEEPLFSSDVLSLFN